MIEVPVKLIRFLVLSGAAASRRACQRLLVEDRVTVNGKTVRQPSLDIRPGEDAVRVDGKPVRQKNTDCVTLMLNKPAGFLCTRRDDKGRKTVFDLLRHRNLSSAGLVTAGRLDYNTTGLLFLTNDGRFVDILTHPRYGILKHYIAVIKGPADPVKLRRMMRGVTIDGERLRFHKVVVISNGEKKSVLRIVLNEGRNREIRRIFLFFRITLKSLQRVRIGDFTLENLAEGSYRLVRREAVREFLAPFEQNNTHPQGGDV